MASSVSSISLSDVHNMLVPELKVELKLRGASTLGKKQELQSRLDDLIIKQTNHPESVSPGAEAVSSSLEKKEDISALELNNIMAGDLSSQDQNNSHNVQTINFDSLVKPNHDPDEDLVDYSPMESENITENMAVAEDQLVVKSIEEEVTSVRTEEEEELRLKALLKMKKFNSTSGNQQQTEINDERRFVRIDYLQRPLLNKGLVKWLEDICECTIGETALWTNSIKTHCYVDFLTHSDAARCIEKVTGQRYPSTSTATLVVHYTNISALDAPSSEEAKLKPGEWMSVGTKRKAVDSVPHATKYGVTTASSAGPGSPRGVGVDLFKKAIATSTGAGVDRATIGGKGAPSGRVVLLGGDNANLQVTSSSGGTMQNRHHTAQGIIATDTGFVTQKGRQSQSDSHASDSNSAVTLDSLFRKTVATPSLYWLPISDTVVRERLLKNKLTAAKG